jgi:hypothetical protein
LHGRFNFDWIGDYYYLCSWGNYNKTQLKIDCELQGKEKEWLRKSINLKEQHGEKVMDSKKLCSIETALKLAGLYTQEDNTEKNGAKNIAKLFIKYFDKWEFKTEHLKRFYFMQTWEVTGINSIKVPEDFTLEQAQQYVRDNQKNIGVAPTYAHIENSKKFNFEDSNFEEEI